MRHRLRILSQTNNLLSGKKKWFIVHFVGCRIRFENFATIDTLEVSAYTEIFLQFVVCKNKSKIICCGKL